MRSLRVMALPGDSVASESRDRIRRMKLRDHRWPCRRARPESRPHLPRTPAVPDEVAATRRALPPGRGSRRWSSIFRRESDGSLGVRQFGLALEPRAELLSNLTKRPKDIATAAMSNANGTGRPFNYRRPVPYQFAIISRFYPTLAPTTLPFFTVRLMRLCRR